MVKTSLLTFNDANLTGNYAVMYAKMAKPFRDRFTADTLKQAFKVFAGKHIDIIAAKPIVPTSAAKFGGNGWLMLRGYFDTSPSRLNYELDFAISEGEWKLIAIDVKVREHIDQRRRRRSVFSPMRPAISPPPESKVQG